MKVLGVSDKRQDQLAKIIEKIFNKHAKNKDRVQWIKLMEEIYNQAGTLTPEEYFILGMHTFMALDKQLKLYDLHELVHEIEFLDKEPVKAD